MGSIFAFNDHYFIEAHPNSTTPNTKEDPVGEAQKNDDDAGVLHIIYRARPNGGHHYKNGKFNVFCLGGGEGL